MTTDSNDIDLLRKWRDGDRRAGDTLIRRHYRYALGRAKAQLGNEDAAVEATQHAMTVLVQKQDALERIEKIEEQRKGEHEHERSKRPPPFRAYLAKIIYFSVLTQTKRRTKQSKHDLFEDDKARPGTVPRGAATMLDHKEEEKLMIKAMRSLSIDDQLVFYYEFVSDKKRTEIAKLIGVSSKGIYKRVNTAKAHLRERLKTFRDSPVGQNTLGGLETWLKSMHAKGPDEE
ncbi:MAG: sigma-70 family RNA polymerase sigma factor [Nannocystaceae bacterium]